MVTKNHYHRCHLSPLTSGQVSWFPASLSMSFVQEESGSHLFLAAPLQPRYGDDSHLFFSAAAMWSGLSGQKQQNG